MVDVKGTKQETVYAVLKHVQNTIQAGNISDYEKQGGSEHLLYQACSLGLIDVLQSLLLHHDVLSKMNYNISDCSRFLYDCLAVAHEEKNEDVIRFLLEFAVSKPTTATSRKTEELLEELVLLHCAAANGDVEMAAVLIDSGFDVNKTNSNGETALHFACNAATAEFFLNNGANIDAMNKRNETPLYYACLTSRLGVIRTLLNYGANRYLGSTYDKVGVTWKSESDKALVDSLMSYYDASPLDIPVSCIWRFKHDENGYEIFSWCTSCKNENKLMIQKLMHPYGIYDDTSRRSNKQYSTLDREINNYYRKKKKLHVADVSEIKRILSISNSATINTLGFSGETFLYHAVERNDMEIATLLLDSGADPNQTSCHRQYPLTVACRYLSHEFVRLLLNKGANPNVTDKYDSSPLHIAAASCDHLLIKMLIEHGADVNHRDRKGRTAFIRIADSLQNQICISMGNNSIESVKCLLDNGLNVKQEIAGFKCNSVLYNTTNENRNCQFARHSIRYKLVKMLLERECDVKLLNVIYGIHLRDTHFYFREILRRGANPNRPDKQGINMLCSACLLLSRYHDQILRASDTDPKKVKWDTLVRNTADYSNELINLLLDCGAKFNDPNDKGGLYNFMFQQPTVITLQKFYMPVCTAAGWIVRLFKAGSTLKLLATCCGYTRSQWSLNPYTCTSTGRLCQAVVLAGHKVQQDQGFIQVLKQSERFNIRDLGSWLEEYSRNPPSLRCLSRAAIRRQLSDASGYRTILPLIDVLPIEVNLRMYLKFEGPLSEIDLTTYDVSCESCKSILYRQF